MAGLAREAGVGLSTVDRVLNGRAEVNDATARRVLEAAERIGFYATPLLRQRLKADLPARSFAFLLQQKQTPFYRILGEALERAVAESTRVRGKAQVEFMDDLAPAVVAEALRRAARTSEGVAMVAADHPLISSEIAALAESVPVVALISDLTAASRVGYVGLDNRKVGRTAGWFLANALKRHAKVAIFVGSHRYLCQEACEIGFRAYLREHAPDISLLDPIATLESDRYAMEATLDLLRRQPDLRGIYVAGGGIGGVLEALRGSGARPVVVAHDLTEITARGLVDGRLHAVLSHPIDAIARHAVDLLVDRTLDHEATGLAQHILPLQIATPESL